MRRAFSMLEMVVAVVVLAIVAAVLLPVINGATDAYASSASAREGSERLAYAMDRMARLLRDWPAGDTGSTVASAKFDASGVIVFSDGRGLVLSGSDLLLLDTDGSTSVLCRDVTTFELGLLKSDGVSDAASDPTLTQRVNITLGTKSAELRSTVFLRARAVST